MPKVRKSKEKGRGGPQQTALEFPSRGEDGARSARSRRAPTARRTEPAAAAATARRSRNGRQRPSKPARSRKPVKRPKSTRSPKPSGAGRPPKPSKPRATAQTMAARQREISVSEFFAKNRHLLGFDNPSKALLTTVKEAVDNSLDACEEADILPEIEVRIDQIAEDRFKIGVEDNGPGIVRSQIPKIFGKLLYGSKFHTFRQARGQQGIGISAAGMYGLLTTGQPIQIKSRTGRRRPAHAFEMAIDTRTNQANVRSEETIEWDKDHGTRVEITIQATYKRGRHSVDGYLRRIAIANPHGTIRYIPPRGDGEDEEVIVFERVTDEMPPQPKEIKPHPYGVELGVLIQLLEDTKARNVSGFLQTAFSRVSARVAAEICEQAGLPPQTKPRRVTHSSAEALHKAMNSVKIMAPPTNCLSPIGEEQLMNTLTQDVSPDFAAAVTRPPAVYRGIPFQIEVGVAYGGDLDADDLISLYRYANRVPLLYQQSACAITKSALAVEWRNYKLSQSRGALPSGPVVLVCHMASAWVPFTSESKEAIAGYPEIMKEIRLALQECGRKLSAHIGRRRREHDEAQKRSYISKYIPHIGIALQEILKLKDKEREKTVDRLETILEKSRRQSAGQS